MSKLADRIKDLLDHGGARPMGFATATAVQKPTMLLIAAGSAKEAAKAEADGADGVLSADKLKIEKALAGQRVSGADKASLEGLASDKVAFAVLSDLGASASGLTVEGIDLVLTIDPTWSDMLTRAVASLPLAAVLYEPSGAGEMTIGDQLQCARIQGLVGKPLLVGLPSGWGTAALAPLQEIGVTGVIVPAGETAAFKEAIRTLPPKKRPGDRGDIASLPSVGTGRTSRRDDDDEEDRATGPATLG